MGKRIMKQVAVAIHDKTLNNQLIFLADSVTRIVGGSEEKIVLTNATPVAGMYISNLFDGYGESKNLKITSDYFKKVSSSNVLKFDAELFKIDESQIINFEYESEDEVETELNIEKQEEENKEEENA